MSDRQVFVLDRDGVARSFSRSFLRKHLQQGNLSEKIQISQNGEHFEPLESASWFHEEEMSLFHGLPTSSSNSIPPSPLASVGSIPIFRSLSQPNDITSLEARSRKSSVSSLNRLKPSLKGAFGIKSSGSRSLRIESSSPPMPFRSVQPPVVLGSEAYSSMQEGLERSHFARNLVSPRSTGSPTRSSRESFFGEKPEDFQENLRSLSAELRKSLSRAEFLQSECDQQFNQLRYANEDLKKENASLKALIDLMRPVVAEHAPHILESGAASSASLAAGSSPQSFATARLGEDEGSSLENSIGIPFDADSPMLREKMDLFEAELDGIRQSIKSCVKSGQSFVQTSAVICEHGVQFAEDLRQSTMPMLKLLGDAIWSSVDGQMKFYELIEFEFLQPLARFANNDLKSANHIRAELERKKEIYENLESKYMSNKRGKDKAPTSSSMTVSASAETPKLPRSSLSASGSGGQQAAPSTGTGDDGGLDKRNLANELRNAEAQYELSRFKLIHALNSLAMNHRVIVNKCVLTLAASMATFHEGGNMRAKSLLESAKVVGVEDSGDIQKRLELCDAQWRKKQQEIENFHFANPRRQDAEKDLVYEGWLWKRSSNVMRDWKKRFFQIVGGQLVYFRNMNREVVCNIGLCSVRDIPRTSGRESAPPRASFEVISPKRALVLMASSEEEKKNWVGAIRKAIEESLGAGEGFSPHSGPLPPNAVLMSADSMADILQEDANHRCFECHAPLDQPNWVSINIGIFLCITCSGSHRSLGTHLSKVRSLLLDKLSPAQLDILRRLGNARAAKIWEAKPEVEEARQRGIEKFIRDKYAQKLFLSDEPMNDSQDAFTLMLLEDNLKRVAWFVAHGQAPFYVTSRSTALHIAASEPNSSPALLEFLLLNGAELGIADENGKTPYDVAIDVKASVAQSVFRQWAATSHVKTSLTEDI